jgi:hypothetical protein
MVGPEFRRVGAAHPQPLGQTFQYAAGEDRQSGDLNTALQWMASAMSSNKKPRQLVSALVADPGVSAAVSAVGGDGYNLR